MKTSQHIAVIDLGTNTFHLVIADMSVVPFEIVFREKVPVKVGEGGIEHGTITDVARERAIKTLLYFKKRIDEFEVKKVRAIATSAFRSAQNGPEIVAEVSEKCGIDIEIVGGLQEARYIYNGVKHSMKLPHVNSLIIDIGGGSVEFILCNDQKILWEESFEIGGQRLMNKFHFEDPITEDSISLLESYLEEKLQNLKKVCSDFNPIELIGASGSFDTIIDIYNARIGLYDRQTCYKIPKSELLKIIKELIAKNENERRIIPGMIEMRVQMIVVASVLIRYVLSLSHFEEVYASRYALKEGVLFESINEI